MPLRIGLGLGSLVLAALLTTACTGTDAGSRSAPASVQRASAPAAPLSDSTWRSLVHRLSEEGGYFDTDNLISNETSYLHVVGALEELGVGGGAYVGVGPDQNFAYMARVRPALAFIVDIRRDNLLQQLLFKALFELSENRAEYLALWTGRDLAAGTERADSDVEELVAAVDGAPNTPETADAAVAAVLDRVRGFGLGLSDADISTIEGVHRTFIRRGLDLRFRSHGRSPRFFYPTLRELLLARDLEGRRSGYLASSQDFRFLKEMQEENRVVPVVGNLAGPHALASVGREVRRRGLTVSALYTSNVEFYLMRDRTFGRFAEAVAGLPRGPSSVIIRSCFNRCAATHPMAVEGHYSAQLLQRMSDFVSGWEDGGYRSYRELVTEGALPLR